MLLDLLHGPIKVVIFVMLLNIGLNIFDWSPRMRLYLSKGLILMVAASLTYLAIKILGLMLDLWQRRHAREADRKFNDQLFSVIRISLNTFVILVAVLVTAQNMNIDITAAIASLSIGGLAVGLAAQDTLANLFGAVAVFVDKPFRAGDQIKLDGAEGVVETVGLRSTRVRSPEGHLIAVPNKTMGNAIITNITQRPSIKTVMNFTLNRSLPTEKIKRAIAILKEIYRGQSHDPGRLGQLQPICRAQPEHSGRALVERNRLPKVPGRNAGNEPRGQRSVRCRTYSLRLKGLLWQICPEGGRQRTGDRRAAGLHQEIVQMVLEGDGIKLRVSSAILGDFFQEILSERQIGVVFGLHLSGRRLNRRELGFNKAPLSQQEDRQGAAHDD